MSPRCTFAEDHTLDSTELAQHATACEPCARAVAVRSLAKQTWSAAKGRDDRTARSARERRLMSGASVARGRHRGVAWSAVVAIVGIATTCVVLALRKAPSDAFAPPQRVIVSEAQRSEGPHGSGGVLRPFGPQDDNGGVVGRGRHFRVVDVRGGLARRQGLSIAAGDVLAAGDEIDVPQGAVVRVLWAIDLAESADGGEEPAVEVVGAARVDVGDGATPLLVLRRGAARVTAGEIAIARGTDAPREVLAGSSVEIEPDPPAALARPAISATTADDSAARLRAAETALDRGDRATAEATLRPLLDHTRDPETRARASLRLAELLLARGASDEARPLLEPLAFGPDPKRAADAAWLYARSLHAPADRAAAWARYLATSPPPAMRSLAQIERASALLDSGEIDGARALVTALDADRAAGSLAPVAADALARLEARLAAQDD
jgi:hypothetical protein